ncbi:hypothetical protein BGZ61DRAFT_373601, partial [Ilyonectria robusta]|uniref:uncharacterized protein n=1 Tax=Ilyonectria robusta TaxID=1079257 RepID=UPI001E8D73C2
QSAIGNHTGSQAWIVSGEQDKTHSQSNMKAEQPDASRQGYGKAEEVAGRAFGYKGMQQKGAFSAKN